MLPCSPHHPACHNSCLPQDLGLLGGAHASVANRIAAEAAALDRAIRTSEAAGGIPNGQLICLLNQSSGPHAGQHMAPAGVTPCTAVPAPAGVTPCTAVPKHQCNSAPPHCHPAVQKEAAAAVEVPAGVPSSHWWFS